MSFGQIVIGPPGSGKTTYCYGMYQFLNALNRKTIIINMDPANEKVPYKSDIDINELINIDDVQEEYGLGPNGSLMYCMEYLENNISWLLEKLEKYIKEEYYLLFDFPGQIEFFTHHDSVQKIIKVLEKAKIRLACVNLVDSVYCGDASKYISVLLMTLTTMMKMELPQINVLSKIDKIESMGKLGFNLEYYTQVMDLEYLLQHLNATTKNSKYYKLNQQMCELVEDYGMVGFQVLNVEDKELMADLVKEVDKANGYIYGALEGEGNEEQVLNVMSKADEMIGERDREVQERYGIGRD